MNFEEGLKEQCLLSLEQTEGRYNRLHNLKASYEEAPVICRGKGNRIYTVCFYKNNDVPRSVT